MDIGRVAKLKKYIFLISILFLMVSLIHIIYIYIYNDAEYKPMFGGNISEGLIGSPPNINPLKLQKGNNKYVTSFLYRSLISYDIKNDKIISDIASCDTNNLLYIECYLENNIKWSNNTDITTKDIISTYKILQTTDVNPLIKSLLSDTEIIEKNNIIIFKNTKKDINFLNVLFSPIVNKNILDNIGEEELYGNFPVIGGIYSGKYILENIISNNIQGIIEVILVKNKNYYRNNIYIEKYILKFFKNTSDFLKNKDSINLFNDKNNIIGKSIPRLQSNNYILPQYVSLSINRNKIKDKNLRNFLLNSINRDNLIKIIGKNFFKPIYNPYISDIKIDKEPKDKNISKILYKLGYFKKVDILKSFLEENKTKIYSNEATIKKKDKPGDSNISSGKLIQKKTDTKNKKKIEKKSKNITKDKSNAAINTNTGNNIKLITKKEILKDFGGKSKVIISPNFIDKYNFITKDNILLKGKVSKNIESVYINNDKIGYNKNKKEFYYTIKESDNNISIGENSYKIYYEVNGNKNFQEEIFFIYNKNKGKLERDKDLFIDKIIKKQQESIKNINKIKNTNKKLDTNKIINKEKFNKINNLNNNLFYDKDLKPLTLNLIYINSEKSIDLAANYIKSSLFQQGININIKPIPISQLSKVLNYNNNLNSSGSLNNSGNLIKSEEISYDMILIGINLGIFDFNLFPYFHSSQVKNGYNFTNINRVNLDILLEELKGNNLDKKKITELEKKVLDILKDEQVIKTLYTPIINNLVDRNIKNYYIPSSLPNKEIRVQSIYNSYILEQKFINLENKSIQNFFRFLYKTINE